MHLDPTLKAKLAEFKVTLKNADLAKARKADENARRQSEEAKTAASQADADAKAVRDRVRKAMVAQTLGA